MAGQIRRFVGPEALARTVLVHVELLPRSAPCAYLAVVEYRGTEAGSCAVLAGVGCVSCGPSSAYPAIIDERCAIACALTISSRIWLYIERVGLC